MPAKSRVIIAPFRVRVGCWVLRQFCWLRWCGFAEQHEVRISVFGAISYYGKSRLVLAPQTAKMDAAEYLKRLQKRVIPDLRTLFGGKPFIWQQVCTAHALRHSAGVIWRVKLTSWDGCCVLCCLVRIMRRLTLLELSLSGSIRRILRCWIGRRKART